MKTRAAYRAGYRPPLCRPATRNTVAAAVAAILAGGAAHAQQAATSDTLEEVVVTGFRHAIETSIAVKKQSDSIVESVSAEDIGKLPDLSIAESIARLPGLAAQRINGRASVISIRGMAPRYAATLLNGREMVSTGDNRSVEYDQFPSELINGVTVYKTPDATLVGMGLSGTVNLLGIRPLEVNGRQMSFNARAERNSNGQLNADTSANGARISASYVNQFDDNKLGVAVGLAYLNTPGQEEHYKSWWWADTSGWGSAICQDGNPCLSPGDPGTPINAIGLQGFEAGAASTKNQRTGLMAVIEYKPSEQFRSMVDLYYSKFDETENRRTLMSDLSSTTSGWGSAYYTNPTTSVVDGNTIITGGNIVGVFPVDLSSLNKAQDDVKAIGWNGQWRTGPWTNELDLSYSRAHRDEQNAEIEAGYADATGKLPVTLTNIDVATGSGRTTLNSSVDYSDPAQNLLTDPEGWGRGGRSQFPFVTDALKSVRLGTHRDMTDSFFSSFDLGVNYSQRSKNHNLPHGNPNDPYEIYYTLKGGALATQISPDLILRPTSLNFGGIPGQLMAFDFFGVLSKYFDSAPAAVDQISGRVWAVEEKVTTAYSKLSFKHEGGLPIHGNFGLQFVHANQRSTGYYWDASSSTNLPIQGGKTYLDVLPSVNLVFDVFHDAYVRFGAARELARPNMEDMRAGLSVDVSDQPPHAWSGSGGNPGLEPWRSDSFDLSFEKYFGKNSYFAVATFYKHLRNFVYTQSIPYDFSGLVNPKPQFTPSCAGGCFLSLEANGHDGLVAGQEYSLALDGGLLTPWLTGIGIVANGSDTRSSLHEEDNSNQPLDGLSGQVVNLTAYYERHGLSARISQRHRSKYTTTVRGTFGDNVPSAILEETIIDMQVGYAFESGSLKGLSMLFQVNNLNNEPYRTQVGISVGGANPSALLPERFTTYGREYLLGVTYAVK